MIKISRPVASPVVEQEVTLAPGAIVPSGDLAWVIPFVLGGVTPTPAEGEKSKPAPIVAAGVRVQATILDGGNLGSILSLSVRSVENAGLALDEAPTRLLGVIEVPLDAVLSNANVPRP